MAAFSSSLFPSFTLEPLYNLFGFLLRRHVLPLRFDYNINCLYLIDKTYGDHRRKISCFFESFLMRRKAVFHVFLKCVRWIWSRLPFSKCNFLQEQQQAEGYETIAATKRTFVWGVAVKHLGATTTTAYIYLVPAITATFEQNNRSS